MWMFSLAILVLAAVTILFVVWKVSRRSRHMTTSDRARFERAWKLMLQASDPHRRIVDAEKILDAALTQLGYEGSFGDKLKNAGPRFSQLQSLWEAHKLRNRIAHEVGMSVTAGDAKRAIRAFEKALHDLF